MTRITKHGTVTITPDEIVVEGFTFTGPPITPTTKPGAPLQEAYEAARSWARERLAAPDKEQDDG